MSQRDAADTSIEAPPKTAVIGASGNVGGHLLRVFREFYPDCVGTCFSRPREGLAPFDIRTPNLEALGLEETGHEAVIITAAKPNIAFCENQKEAAHAVNVRGTLELLRQIGRTRLAAIFISSDYVFDGRGAPHDDDTPLRPSTEYGRQKAEVEKEIGSLVENWLVLRLSKIYGIEPGDGTLLDEMGAALLAGRPVRAARDQVFSPTYVGDVARAVLGIQRLAGRRQEGGQAHFAQSTSQNEPVPGALTGVMNVCSPERWSRYDVAVELARRLSADPGLVEPIALYDLPGMAGRPLDTSMRCTRLERDVGVSFTPLLASIERYAEAVRDARGGDGLSAT